jgi:hypothetical protein
MCDFGENYYNFLELDYIKLDETIILCPLHFPEKKMRDFQLFRMQILIRSSIRR